MAEGRKGEASMSRLLVVSMLAVMLVPAHTAGQTTEPARRFAWDVARAVLIDRTGGWR